MSKKKNGLLLIWVDCDESMFFMLLKMSSFKLQFEEGAIHLSSLSPYNHCRMEKYRILRKSTACTKDSFGILPGSGEIIFVCMYIFNAHSRINNIQNTRVRGCWYDSCSLNQFLNYETFQICEIKPIGTIFLQ